METRSRTTKLIVKNVEMLVESHLKIDKIDKVAQWLDKLDTFECHQQHNKYTSSSETSSNVQNNRVDKNNDDFFDSDSSVNTGNGSQSDIFQFLFFSTIVFFFLFFLSLQLDTF
jgi:zona occludens toxin (predicted ATPase)